MPTQSKKTEIVYWIKGKTCIILNRSKIKNKPPKTKGRDDRYCQLQLVISSRMLTTMNQRTLTLMIQDDDNLPFGNNINNYDEFQLK